MTQGYRDFEFDLPGALLTHLVAVLDGMEAAPLTLASLTAIPEAQGVYQLFFGGDLVYIGKTDAEAGLRRRLERHQWKIQHRANLDPARMTFKAVRVYVFTAIDLETQLISHYGGVAAVQWNGSGFGANDPGRRRDKTNYKADHFDVRYPIDIDHALTDPLPTSGSAAAILAALKFALPYVLRYENSGASARQAHPELETTVVTLPAGTPITARGVIAAVVSQLPPGWQATRLPGLIILYRETETYPFGEIIARS